MQLHHPAVLVADRQMLLGQEIIDADLVGRDIGGRKLQVDLDALEYRVFQNDPLQFLGIGVGMAQIQSREIVLDGLIDHILIDSGAPIVAVVPSLRSGFSHHPKETSATIRGVRTMLFILKSCLKCPYPDNWPVAEDLTEDYGAFERTGSLFRTSREALLETFGTHSIY